MISFLHLLLLLLLLLLLRSWSPRAHCSRGREASHSAEIFIALVCTDGFQSALGFFFVFFFFFFRCLHFGLRGAPFCVCLVIIARPSNPPPFHGVFFVPFRNHFPRRNRASSRKYSRGKRVSQWVAGRNAISWPFDSTRAREICIPFNRC